MDHDYPRGTVTIEISLKLTDVPGDTGTWKEGGTVELKLVYTGSLVDNRHHREMKVEFKLGGKGEVERDGVKASLDTMETEAREQKSGRVDK
jgi:hypothetical protein